MKNKITLLALTLLISVFTNLYAQVTIGSGNAPLPFSILQIDTGSIKGGIRLPQIRETGKDSILVSGNTTTAPGLTIYNTTSKSVEYWDGTVWVKAKPIEPWMASGRQAESNTENIYQMGKVGIGTAATPGAKLEVAGDAIIRQMADGANLDSIVVVKNGLLKKIAQTATSQTTGNFSSSSEISVTNGTGATLKDISASIVASSIATGKIADGAITSPKINNKAITLQKIADGTAAGQVMKWNGTQWALRPDSIVEPWQVSGSTTLKASANNQDIYQTGRVGIGTAAPLSQLHVKAASDPVRIEGVSRGTKLDSIMYLNSSGIVTQRSVTNLRKDIVAAPDPDSQKFAGMMKYDAATKTMQYYDGTTWQIVASNIYGGKNEGVAKINSGAGNAQPTFDFSAESFLDKYQYVKYATPITLANITGYWPENITSPAVTDLVRNNNTLYTTFIENPIDGQFHTWRIIGSYTGKSGGGIATINVRLKNPVSGFTLTGATTCQKGSDADSFSINISTIADSGSLPTDASPNRGYYFDIVTDTKMRITINSITRISTYKD